jgi:hypothetical protein
MVDRHTKPHTHAPRNDEARKEGAPVIDASRFQVGVPKFGDALKEVPRSIPNSTTLSAN